MKEPTRSGNQLRHSIPRRTVVLGEAAFSDGAALSGGAAVSGGTAVSDGAVLPASTVLSSRAFVLAGIILLMVCTLLSGVPDSVGVASAGADRAEFDHAHSTLDALLGKYVQGGRVDYPGLQKSRAHLQDYLQMLADLPRAEFDGFTANQQLALLINAYNALTLELILQHYPVASIQDIPGNWTEPQWTLYGRKINLDDLENQEIRGRFSEPRIHCALVCAALSCPHLRAEAYRADRLSEQLAEASRDFARNPSLNRLDTGTATLYVSKIFEWFSGDFARIWGETVLPEGSPDSDQHRGIVGFMMTTMTDAEADFLRSSAVRIAFNAYNWGLNGQLYE